METEKLAKETVLVIGLGEIGRSLFELLRDEKEKFMVYGLDLDKRKMRAITGRSKIPSEVDTMHICFPFSNQEVFITAVSGYFKQLKPKLVIINSTVPPGTTLKVYEQCQCLVAHSPVRGVHESLEYMKWELKRWTKYIGGVNENASKAACKHFEKMNLKVKVLKSCTETELAKLFETTYRAWMISCFQEMHRISISFNGNFDNIVDFLEDTHRVRLDRPIMFPGVIGGHCLIPNTELLLSVYNSEFLRLILESNKKRKKEINDKKISAEVAEVRNRSECFEKELKTIVERATKVDENH